MLVRQFIEGGGHAKIIKITNQCEHLIEVGITFTPSINSAIF